MDLLITSRVHFSLLSLIFSIHVVVPALCQNVDLKQFVVTGAKQPNYLVTADDVDTYLAIEVQPLDERKRKV